MYAALHSSVRVAPSQVAALEMIETSEVLDAIFLCCDWEEAKMQKFLEQAKQAAQRFKTPPIFLVSLKADQSDASYIAPLYLAGVNGFISEPYSANQVVHLIEQLAGKPAGLLIEENKRPALLNYTLGQALAIVDFLASRLITKPGRPDAHAMKQFRRMADILDQFKKDMPEQFEELLIKKTINLEPPKHQHADKRVIRKKDQEIPKHPGMLICEQMQTRGLTSERVLESLKWAPADLDAVLQQRVSLTEAQSRDVARVLGQTAKYWFGLQQAYDAWLKKKKSHEEDGKKPGKARKD
jgi:plasmid maintenance system antidote protein VapI